MLYGYTNLADRNELLRIVTLLAAKDRRDPVVTATAFDFTCLTDRNPIALPPVGRQAAGAEDRLPACHGRWRPAPRATR